MPHNLRVSHLFDAQDGKTALMQAYIMGRMNDIPKMLLDAHANIDVKDSVSTSCMCTKLYHTIWRSCALIIPLLLRIIPNVLHVVMSD